jgi:hypothetical protein
MIIKAITSGAANVKQAADVMGVTQHPLQYLFNQYLLKKSKYFKGAGRRWMDLKSEHKPKQLGKHTNQKKKQKTEEVAGMK